MKYKAVKLQNGKYAVGSSKKFFPKTMCDTENKAQIKACEESALWYDYKKSECERKWAKLHRANGKKEQWEDDGNPENAFDFELEWAGVFC